MKYALDRFDPKPFEQMATALARRMIGSDVQAFGSGKDQGRDFTFNGAIDLQERVGLSQFEAWSGYTVFQVKCKDGLSDRPDRNAQWVLDEAKKEIDIWASGTRSPLPRYLVFVTNVPLTPAKNGGLQKVEEGLRSYLMQTSVDGQRTKKIPGLAGVRVWDGNQVESLLDTYPDIARRFVGLTSPAEVLDMIGEFTDSLPLEQVQPALSALSRRLLTENRYARFDEAGASDERRTLLHDVYFDLPLTERGTTGSSKAVNYVIRHGEQVLRPSVVGDAGPKHLLITGSPGNGKSTVTQFLERVYHCAFLRETELVGLHSTVRDGVIKALQRNNAPLPQNRRWAFRVDLAEYVARYDSLGESTMLRWIAERCSAVIDEGRLTSSNLASWRRQWPWLLLLDGLDEVTETETRRRLVEEIESMIAEADTVDADLLVVVTTRPTGYADELESTYFKRMDLALLQTSDAKSYSRLVAEHRFAGDASQRETVLRGFDTALASPETANLMRTPLQILIILIILESSGSLPNDRFRLFWGYYKAVFARESKKPTALAPLLRDHEPQVEAIHMKAAVRLHVESQMTPNSLASISPANLRVLVEEVLAHEGFQDNPILVDKIVDAATERLVLLVPRPGEGIGFEVRSMQEVLTAKAITDGPDDVVIARLRTIAHSPHWRNAFIFAIGRVFSDSAEHLRSRVIDTVRGIDSGETWRLGAVCRMSPRLALDLVDDGLAARRPKHERALLEIGLGVFDDPPPSNPELAARILVGAAERNPTWKKLVASALRDALSGGPVQRESAYAIQSTFEYAAPQFASAQELATVKMHPGTSLAPADQYSPEVDWADLSDKVTAIVESESSRVNLRSLVSSLSQLGHEDGDVVRELRAVLRDEDAATALELTLQEMRVAVSQEIATLRDLILPALLRDSIAAEDLELDGPH